MERQVFTVSVPSVPGVSRTDMADYIREAVQMWAGQYEPPGGRGEDSPGHPLFVAIYRNQSSVDAWPSGS